MRASRTTGIDVERLYKERTSARTIRADAMFVLGVDPVAWSALDEDTVDEYGKLVENGGRLVIGFPARAHALAIPK